jgi:rsbT antagonist protein RsbS
VALDDALVLELKDDIARTIYDQGGKGVIIDVSGIDVMDSFITRAIFDIASITSLMGVQTVLCGISPTIAMTLVEMGLGMEGIDTTMDLESAYEMLKDLEPEGPKHDDEWDLADIQGDEPAKPAQVKKPTTKTGAA